jgi:hypothetical protein
MKYIYRDAELTIVAAAGESADHGLCGVSVSRHAQQTIAVARGITPSFRTLTPPTFSYLNVSTDGVWATYSKAVKEYSRRTLSDSNDRLRAFSGILRFLGRPLHAPFFFGLPSSLFDIALLWKPDDACERGPTSQPSWSWTGWNGCARYYYTFCGSIRVNVRSVRWTFALITPSSCCVQTSKQR